MDVTRWAGCGITCAVGRWGRLAGVNQEEARDKPQMQNGL